MLPVPISDEYICPVPKCNLADSDNKNFVYKFRGFHEPFGDCLQFSESRAHIFNFMIEPFSTFERNTIEPIALSLSYGHVRALQRFVSDAPWDEEVMIAKFVVLPRMILAALTAP